MQFVRQVIGAPFGGPTGPFAGTVLVVPTGGTVLNLNEPKFAQLKAGVDNSNPLMMTNEGGANVYYHYVMGQGSGPAADPTMSVVGPTAANMAGLIFGNTRLDTPEQAPQGAQGLAIAAGAGGTATLRIWRTG